MNLFEKTFIHHGNNMIVNNIKYNNVKLTKKLIDEVNKAPFTFAMHNKRFNGLWASIYNKNNNYRSSWEKFCLKNDLRSKEELNEFVKFKITKNAKVLIINNTNELYNLDSRYAYIKKDDNKKVLSEKLMNTDVNSNDYSEILSQYLGSTDIVLLNPYNIANDYDALFISIDAIKTYNSAFKYWDVETLLVFNTDICIIED